MPADLHRDMVAHAYAGLPNEACGLFAGEVSDDGAVATVHHFYATENEAASAKFYTVPSTAHMRADRDADDRGWEILGVMHSHTHTDAYPSPTDISQAPYETWHYAIVSLRDDLPALRSFRIVAGEVTEEPVELTD
jgi:[CysO sulfur-carrier protein]-S-L-cysteine hydrolase